MATAHDGAAGDRGSPRSPWSRDRVEAARLFRWVAELPELAGLEPEGRDALAAAATLEAARGPAFQERWTVALVCLGLGPCLVVAAFLAALRGAIGFAVGWWLLGALVSIFVALRWSMRRRCRSDARRHALQALSAATGAPPRAAAPEVLLAMAELRKERERIRRPSLKEVTAIRLAQQVEATPELRGLDAELRGQLAREAAKRATTDPLASTLTRLLVVVVLLGVILPRLAARHDRLLLLPLCFNLVCFGLLFYPAWRRRRLARSHLRLAMLLSGIRPARCFACKKDLRGVEASACPGCGARLLRAG